MKSLIPNSRILLTLDYELYGNGSGDVFKHIIEPTRKILNIAQRFNARVTIFFEVIEYWKLKEEWDKGNKMGYVQNPVEAMECQIKNAYRNGHDVQLHLHPQWIDAIFTEQGWKVNLNRWRLTDRQDDEEECLEKLLRRGKDTLERLIDDPEYRCIALRAGGYNVQPSQGLVQAMRRVGLKADSSIYPGGKESGSLSRYDYTAISPDKGWWFAGNCLEETGVGRHIVEIPIAAFPIIRYRKYLSPGRIQALLQNSKSARDAFDAKTAGEKKGLLSKIAYFFQKEWQTWDFCLFSNAMHRNFIKSANRQYGRCEYVLVGHPKSFVADRPFIYLLEQTRNKFQYITISQFLNNLQ